MHLSMNKKELNEIKKNFTDFSGLLSIERVQTAYVNSQKEICCKSNKQYALILEAEAAVLMDSLRQVLKGTLGKNFNEYKFPAEAYEQYGAQKTLYAALRTKLDSDEDNDALISRIVNGIDYDLPYALLIAYCTYAIPTKDKNDELDGNADDVFSFMVAAICPAEQTDFGFVYDSEKKALVKKDNTDLLINKKPTDGFMFPVFSDRAADVNSVAYYTSTANKPNVQFVENVLDCKYTMSATGAKKAYQALIREVVGNEMSVAVATQVNDAIKSHIAMHKNDTELPTIDAATIKHALSVAGVSDEKLETLETCYKEKIGTELIASNIVENKLNVRASDINISVGDAAQQCVRTTIKDGHWSLVVDLYDSAVQINGIDAKLYTNATDAVTIDGESAGLSETATAYTTDDNTEEDVTCGVTDDTAEE